MKATAASIFAYVSRCGTNWSVWSQPAERCGIDTTHNLQVYRFYMRQALSFTFDFSSLPKGLGGRTSLVNRQGRNYMDFMGSWVKSRTMLTILHVPHGKLIDFYGHHSSINDYPTTAGEGRGQTKLDT
ncbi:hypothetical protein E1B28_009160 [Marasmius oreades]|uniref:Uncharacterized protein n=1 Tax=Marasmius oreades TaxID=181124 RepID=A0A9P7RZW7_9AGAR|nr:uncharacterized protein E1B28_009160 [Marasmius oreades]KAG7092846.1 hypothetical protein E1B28_009160 [Marasmius oreades]